MNFHRFTILLSKFTAMGLKYGIGICTEALQHLSSEETLDSRVYGAPLSLNIMKREERPTYTDLSEQNYERIQKLWKNQVDKDNTTALADVSERIVSLCVDIIEENTRMIIKHEEEGL